MILEICANSLQSAINAEEGGADRIELCENLSEGGTTPSYGLLLKTRHQVSIPVHVLIRPRAGDFLYSDLEFEVMKEDIKLCKDLGFEGVVIGILKADGRVDVERTRVLTQLASPMTVTFHRAFDCSNNPEEALEEVIACGCHLILTSGLKATAEEGAALLDKLIVQAEDRIRIMPGSGVHSGNMAQLKERIRATEWHASAKSPAASAMQYQNTDLTDMGSQPSISNTAEVSRLRSILKA